MFNFPSSPADGAVFTPAGGPSYIFSSSSGVWKMAGSGTAFTVVSDTPPPNPFPGMLWWESDTGALFFWYVDANSSQWVQINFTPSGARTAETRNRIVNGAMQVSQEIASGTSLTVSSAYFADQWYEIHNLDGALAFANDSAPLYLGSDAGLRCGTTVVSTADTSIAAGQYHQFAQIIEGIRLGDFNWGTASALPIVVRFKAACTVPLTFTVALRNGANNRVYAKNCTIAANTPTWFTFAIPGDTAGTWAKDNTSGLYFSICLAAGSTFNTAVDSQWSALTNVFATPQTGNFFANAGARFSFGAVGLYLDPDATGVPPKWAMPDEAQELAACQRYWQKTSIVFGGNTTNTAGYYAGAIWPVTMRVTVPAFAGLNMSASGFAATVGTLTGAGAGGVYEMRAATATTTGWYMTNVTCNARM